MCTSNAWPRPRKWPIRCSILLAILAAVLVIFIAGCLRVNLVGLLVLSALALAGLVTPQEALVGFSSPAVVTVWALFILSAGLTRTGLAHQLGRPLQRFTKGSEALLVLVLMTAASLLSALINTVTVAAILLPSTMELARRSGRPPSRLLMPLALNCLLGGPFTGISTPPNILVTDALRNAGFRPFAIFDFTPITAAIVATGIAFMVIIGRRLLPSRAAMADSAAGLAVSDSYQISLLYSHTLYFYLFSIRESRKENAMILKPQDVLVLLKLVSIYPNVWAYNTLAVDLNNQTRCLTGYE